MPSLRQQDKPCVGCLQRRRGGDDIAELRWASSARLFFALVLRFNGQ